MLKQELKNEFRKRIYHYVLRLIKFLVKLPKDAVTKEIISKQRHLHRKKNLAEDLRFVYARVMKQNFG